MLHVSDLYFDYDDEPLLKNITFSLEYGQILHLKGANGAGKSTLLKLLSGLITPLSGVVRHQESICYIGHKTGVHPYLTVAEYLRFDAGWHESMEEILTPFSMVHMHDVWCGLLSAGQRRKVALMRLRTTQATLWLLDEPWMGLDGDAVAYLNSLLLAHLKSGGGVVVTAHHVLDSLFVDVVDYSL